MNVRQLRSSLLFVTVITSAIFSRTLAIGQTNRATGAAPMDSGSNNERLHPHSAGPGGQPLADMLTSPSNAVAIAGSWQRLEVAMRHGIANDDLGMSSAKSLPKYTSRFLGFVEGRLNVVLPKAWADCLDNVEIYWNGHFRFPVQSYSPWKNRDAQVDRPHSIPRIKFSEDDKSILIAIGTGDYPSVGSSGSIQLPEWMVHKLKISGIDGMSRISSALLGNDKAYLAVSSINEPSGTLYCISRSTGKELWSTPMMKYGGEHYKGSGEWFTELRLSNNTLMLFHCCETGIGIEGVSVEGQLQFRFSSNRSETEQAP